MAFLNIKFFASAEKFDVLVKSLISLYTPKL